MWRRAFGLVLAPLAPVLVGCSTDDGEVAAATTTVSTETSVVELTIPESTDAEPAPEGAGAGVVIMLKLHVGDVDDATDFYGTVFGATTAYELGEGIRVMTMADGPGFILIEDGPGDAEQWNGSFLIQVPDLTEAVDRAEANGATSQQAFEGSPGGEQARSVDLLDPWGNQIEILQLD